ncbi:MAG: ATP-binding protein [Alphaproteobacteria bacterium HGW-Alphaproteobacteria-16]|nr:MAG: ATP-binding protein [Alphaproteobacteria bacterium HGW-Alphaproteobacteria-16]
MTLPASIQPSISQALIGKVTRLFNGTVTDVLNELFQNARRAGATQIIVDTAGRDGTYVLSIRDDGVGIADPASLLALGDSGWNSAIMAREDPAGMGVFSLAGQNVTVRSCARGSSRGWRVAIPADAWEGGIPLPVEDDAIAYGTEFAIELDDDWQNQLLGAITQAARYYPLPVRFRGQIMASEDFLAEADHVEIWNGCRIGIYRGDRSTTRYTTVNFHGVAIRCTFPDVREVDYPGHHWTARVDIIDAPNLQLVLPARKEMVENSALKELRAAVEGTLYRAIAQESEHRLPFRHWHRAKEIGIDLPEATICLHAWVARTAERERPIRGEPVTNTPMGIINEFLCDIEQAAAQVLREGRELGFRPVRPLPAFEGYRWYDTLPRVTEIAFNVVRDGESLRFDANGLDPHDWKSGRVPAITMNVTIDCSGETEDDLVVHSFPLDMLVRCQEDNYPEEAVIFVREDASVTPDALVSLLEACCFSYRGDEDGWDCAYEGFISEARHVAARLLLGEEAALIERLRTTIREELLWMIPAGRRLELTATSGDMTFALDATS